MERNPGVDEAADDQLAPPDPHPAELEALEDELRRVRNELTARRSAIGELKTALAQLSWSEVSLARRLALGVGMASGVGAFVGLVSLLHLVKEAILGAVP